MFVCVHRPPQLVMPTSHVPDVQVVPPVHARPQPPR